MATANITEFLGMGNDAFGQLAQALAMPPLAKQNVTYTTSTQSNALNGQTKVIRIAADDSAACHVEIGSNPTATATSVKIPAGAVDTFVVEGGEIVACYDGSS